MPLFRTRYDQSYFEAALLHERHESLRNRNRLKEILACCDGGRLLEIGCGMGGFTHLARRHFEVECMEINAYAATRVRRDLGVPTRVANIEEATLPRARYNVAAAFNVFEHLRDPRAVLERIASTIVPGGVLVGSVPNKFALLGGIHTGLTNLFDRTHVSTLTPGQWQAHFRDTGYQPVRFFGELLCGPNRSLHIHSSAWPYLSFNLMFVAFKPDLKSLPA